MKNKEIKTRVVESFYEGHQVEFSIDHQTFRLDVCEDEEDWSSLDKAEWYERQLNIAFNRLLNE